MRIKRAGFGVKFVILALLVVLVTAALSTNSQLATAKEERDALAQEVRRQEEKNAALADDIAHCDDPERIEDIAREKLGLIGRDEIVFVDASK